MNRALLNVDPIEELRLRRWAREHYAPAGQRTDLHPVIVHEMQRKDEEIGERPQPRRVAGRAPFSSIVPLMPEGLKGVHGPHEINPPHARSRTTADELHYT